jgi:sec-independent protein translocase protein TatA
MLDIGIQELLVLMVLALLVFGPDKLPELGRRLGRAMREFRRASDEFRSTVEQNLQLNADHDILPPSAAEPFPASPGPSDGAAPLMTAENGGGSGEASAAPAGSGGDAPDESTLEPYWASRGGRLLHRRECAWRGRVPEAERIPLKTAAEAWEQGLKACPACDPREAEVAS